MVLFRTPEHVYYWIRWAIGQFSLSDVNLCDWIMYGKRLCELTEPNFGQLVREDPHKLFWKHFQILRTKKVAATIQLHTPQHPNDDESADADMTNQIIRTVGDEPELTMPIVPMWAPTPKKRIGRPIELWQFLLELLDDPTTNEFIGWVPKDRGFPEFSFVFHHPEAVARLWGERKKRPGMNYDKLARALRYYYSKKRQILAKVSKAKFTYHFTFKVADYMESASTKASEDFQIGFAGRKDPKIYGPGPGRALSN